MTKAHELDRSKQTAAAAPHHDDAVAPGRIARSAALVGPNGPMPTGLIQRKARDANGVEEGAGDAVARASSSSGAALPEGLMRKFEASLGADLSGVRVHTGSESAEAASAVGAKAYTLGQEIHFGAGHFDPSSSSGEHLLAHEVAHTVQQRGDVARMQLKPAVSSPGDAHEVEADRAADAMVGGNAFAIAGFGGGVQRQQDAVGGNVTVEGDFGEQSAVVGTDKYGRPSEVGTERELFKKSYSEPFGPGFYWTLGVAAKVSSSTGKETEGSKAEQKGKLVVEGSGSIGIGGAKDEAKIGIEGQVTLQGACEVTMGRESMFEGNPAITLTAAVNLRLVAQASEKLGGNVSKQLSKLVIFRGNVTGNGLEGQWCGKEDIIKAAQDLRDNAAATGLLGAPGVAVQAYRQSKQDAAAQKEFDENLKNMPDQQMTSDQPARLREHTQGYAEREKDIHEEYDRQIESYKAIAEKSKAPFNHEQARDQAWWKGNAYSTFNTGAVHMMTANETYAKYKTAEGTNAVKPLAEKTMAEYNEAHNHFLDAQRQQFGDVQTG